VGQEWGKMKSTRHPTNLNAV